MGWLLIALFGAFVAGMLTGVLLVKFPPAGLEAPQAPPMNPGTLATSRLEVPSVELAELGATLESCADRIRTDTPGGATR